MKISIITVCRNASLTIEACLHSIAEQTYKEIEHIVVDGASTDDTLAIVRTFPHVQEVVSEPDRGVYDAMNKGLQICTGDLVLFLNADDRLYNASTIADAIRALTTSQAADVYYGWLEMRPLLGEPCIFQPPPPGDVPDFMVTGCLPHQSTIVRRAAFSRIGPFDTRYRIHAEYDWYLKALSDPTIRFAALPLVIGSFAEGGLSSQLERGQPEVHEIQRESSLYAGSYWDKRRIDLLQQEVLNQRLEVARLKERLAMQRRERTAAEVYGSSGLFKRLIRMNSREIELFPLYPSQPAVFAEPSSRRFLLTGWSSHENWGVWSDGSASRLGFVAPAPASYRLLCRVTPFFSRSGRQSVVIRINGRRAAKWIFRSNSPERAPCHRLVDLPQTSNGRYEIEFQYSEPTTPVSLGSTSDLRELALGLVEMQLQRGD